MLRLNGSRILRELGEMDHRDKKGLFSAVLSSAAEFGQQPAVVAAEQTMTYQHLVQSAGALATGLGNLGVGRGDRVGLLLPNCPQFIISYLAITALGAVVVPVDCQLSAEETTHILNHAQVQGLISLAEFDSTVIQLQPNVTSLTNFIISGQSEVDGAINWEELMCASADRPTLADAALRDDAAVIIYLPGTTGRPKGAVLSHRNLLANSRSCMELIGVTNEDTFLAVLPLFNAFGAVVCMILPLMVGASIVLPTAFVPVQVLEAIEAHSVSIFAGVPSIFAVLIGCRTTREYDLSSLRLCVCGGAPLPPGDPLGVLRGFRKRYGVALVEGHGTIGASPVISVNLPDGVQKPGSVGAPIPGVRVRIVDEAGRDVPPEQEGQIVVAGENVMQGYWRDPEATAETIRDGWLYTGDLGRLDADGYLYIVFAQPCCG